MFTGIVQAVGQVRAVEAAALVVDAPPSFGRGGFDLGESVAVNGCCLTVIASDGPLTFDVSPETWRRTSLACLRSSDPVNLERAMSADGRFGGHIVQGHVDATGGIVSLSAQGEFTVLRVQAPAEYDRYLIDKGSITVDGISLTVVEPKEGAFDVWLVPHTLSNTNLHARRPGDGVNLEFDVIAKYVEKLVGRTINQTS
ncbi:riboflavin synthase [Fimbriimonas ginsengisoli]|uniref:Riboflavin synthase n=1 Tax=Fimbriimonas ginsengisoli Gsoil 348 TaxID=661478 RepID=A0A068NPR3_FIMGI|nr:riboflavin synthase [Fimbriimonas ginsengisoli]AIE85372.1 riboflavin synthase, alpha subunit [Fimbriimonas ginsengisoli Gsoil 348]